MSRDCGDRNGSCNSIFRFGVESLKENHYIFLGGHMADDQGRNKEQGTGRGEQNRGGQSDQGSGGPGKEGGQGSQQGGKGSPSREGDQGFRQGRDAGEEQPGSRSDPAASRRQGGGSPETESSETEDNE